MIPPATEADMKADLEFWFGWSNSEGMLVVRQTFESVIRRCHHAETENQRLRQRHAELGIECEALRLETERLRGLLERWFVGCATHAAHGLVVESKAVLYGE